MKKLKALGLILGVLFALSSCKKTDTVYATDIPVEKSSNNSVDTASSNSTNPDIRMTEDEAVSTDTVIDSVSNNNFTLSQLIGTKIYQTTYVEKRCGDDYYSYNENDVKPMRFIVSKNTVVVKGSLVDKMINAEGIFEMEININSLTETSTEDGKEAKLYDASCSFNTGEGFKNTGAVLKIWCIKNEIVYMRIVTDRTKFCRYSFILKPLSNSKERDSVTDAPTN